MGKKLGVKQVNIPGPLHRRALKLKYILLAVLILASFYSLTLAERLAEVEPFKTAVTLMFVRAWPFLSYAVALLAAGMFIHKFYCRYLCPLGAGLAIIGKLRRFEWLDRRAECGNPCQLCRHRCGINAIEKSGAIDYNECIQCFECVVILRDKRQCAPQRVAGKTRLFD